MALKDVPDEELINRARTGEQQAMLVLYDRYAGLVYSVAFKILRNRSDAEELTQDIFIRLWQKENYQSKRGSLKSFLGLLTRHRAIDRLRQRNTSQNVFEKMQQSLYENSRSSFALEELESQERQEKLKKALSFLPQEQRQLLIMNFFEGSSQREIAKKLNLPVGTVKSRIRSAFIKLKRILVENSIDN